MVHFIDLLGTLAVFADIVTASDGRAAISRRYSIIFSGYQVQKMLLLRDFSSFVHYANCFHRLSYLGVRADMNTRIEVRCSSGSRKASI